MYKYTSIYIYTDKPVFKSYCYLDSLITTYSNDGKFINNFCLFVP